MEFSTFRQADEAEIQQLFTEVFTESEGEAEGELIGRLVLELMRSTEPGDIFGFVVREQAEIIGGVFFTRLYFNQPVEAFLLSPAAVCSRRQGRGLGQRLLRYGLEELRKTGVALAFTYGDPAFYTKVGFQPITEDLVRAPFPLSRPEGWLGQALAGGLIKPLAGNSKCVKALNRPEYW